MKHIKILFAVFALLFSVYMASTYDPLEPNPLNSTHYAVTAPEIAGLAMAIAMVAPAFVYLLVKKRK